MKPRWKLTTLSNIAEVIGRGITPKYSEDGDYVIINQRCIRNGRVNLENARSHDSSSRSVKDIKRLVAGDILVNSTGVGTLGRTAPWRGTDDLKATVDSHVTIVRPKLSVNPQWLGYLFSSIEPLIESLGHGSTGQTELAASSIADIELFYPPLSTQKQIASLLGTLDDKIESNRAQQHLGEQLVRALIERIIDQFSGADFTTLDAYCTHLKESVQPENLVSGDKYIALEHMPRGSVFLNSWVDAEDAGISSNKTRFRQGDLLFGKLRPYFKKVGVAPVSGVCSTDILVIRPRLREFLSLITVVASSDALINSVSASATGTRMPRASWKDISKWPVPRIADETLITLLRPTNQLIAFSQALSFQNIRLAEVRDALLPELMSGRMRVDEAGQLVCEALDEEVC
jgi:type I restriction-modification system specificity determinant